MTRPRRASPTDFAQDRLSQRVASLVARPNAVDRRACGAGHANSVGPGLPLVAVPSGFGAILSRWNWPEVRARIAATEPLPAA
jgi:hypothetical protein